MSSCTSKDYVVPGWNDIVKDKHEMARSAYLDWKFLGRPRQGAPYMWMRKTRAQFKLALRYCKQNEEMLCADMLASSVFHKQYDKFWQSVRKCNNGKATKHVQMVDGCTGDMAIADRWRCHYEKLYNTLNDNETKCQFYQRLENFQATESDDIKFTVQEVADACKKQKLGKALGADNIAMEAFIYGTTKLFVHVSLLFHLFVKHGHLPYGFMKSVIVPLVKNKSGNLADLNNYRAIAISPAISKLFESIVEKYLRVHPNGDHDECQFGFKPGLSTTICTDVFKRTVEYYISRGSHVFASFIDFTKAFDYVNYWTLFNKLLDDRVKCKIVRILAVWYSRQACSVKWGSETSCDFHIGNGTRQGSVLSPFLFARYIRELLGSIHNTGIGCFIGNMCVNIIAYADDLVIIAPSWHAMQTLLNVLQSQSAVIDMSCNANKTVCMMFKPVSRKCIINTKFPLFKIGDSFVKFVSTFKYLGHLIVDNLSDDEDILREIRSMFVRCNILSRKFAKCSTSVKTILFRSFCLCFYDISLWRSFKSCTLDRFRSCYNKCAKMFFGYRKYDSVTSMLLTTGLPSFDTVVSNARCKTLSRWCVCQNTIVLALRTVCR